MKDEILINSLRYKEEYALEIVVDKYDKLLKTVARCVLGTSGTPEDVEECVLDTYMKLWENPQAYNCSRGTLKTFLVAITKNKAIDRLRQLSKMSFDTISEQIPAQDGDIPDKVADKELCRHVYEALGKLKPIDREIIVRRYFLDEKPSVISKKMSLPSKEVENRLYQSKLRLRKFWEKE